MTILSNILLTALLIAVLRASQAPSQRYVCDYQTKNEELHTSVYEREYIYVVNDTVDCRLNNADLELSCYALMRYVFTTDLSGNPTRELEIFSQGCWTTDVSVYKANPCPVADECIQEQHRPDPEGYVMCCCRKDRCNRAEKLTILPYGYSSSTDNGEDISMTKRQASTEKVLIITLASSVGFLTLITFILISVYCYRKNQHRGRTIPTQHFAELSTCSN
ncbi:uncharacterized protein [Watersipora subatra]|uniref:uncharacterized protein n=1 Tax=Watersipora subatra TaxID=2589382 RepID=UPI00355C13EF